MGERANRTICLWPAPDPAHMMEGKTLAKLARPPVGAGSPANTGKAGAIHRGACFAGEPAPTGLLDIPAIQTYFKTKITGFYAQTPS